MNSMVIEVPSDVVDAVRLPPNEMEGRFKLELALSLYQQGILPLGKARKLALLDRLEFEEVLVKRSIPRHYTATELEEDINYAFGRQ